MTYLNRWHTGESTGLTPGKVVCVGRNYAEHAKELNNPIPSSPILFIKPTTALVHFAAPPLGEAIVIPEGYGECHYEAEIAVLVGQTMKNVTSEKAHLHIAGYGLGLDLTLRDLQSQLKEKGHPWEVAKSFDGACPMTDFVRAQMIRSAETLGLVLRVNGQVRQKGEVSQMLTPIAELLSYMSGFFTLEAGDIVLTGTPAGVSALARGDKLQLSLLEADREVLVANSSVA